MLRNTFILSAIVLSACAQPSTPQAAGPSESAETVEPAAARIFASGTIYTGVEGETVDTVAVDGDGRIVWTGAIDDLDTEVDIEGAEFVWLDNNFMYPGFTDSHAHLLGIGQRELSLDLADTASLEELVTRIEAEAGGLGDEAIIVGRGWIETDWPEGRMPAAADLDAAVGDRLVILMRADGHALVASTAALNAAGIDETTPDPEGGKIERDSDGKATGILIDNAMTPVWGLVAEPSEEEIRRAYVEGSRVYAERGWTGLHNMSVPPAHAPLMAELDAAGEMPVRIYNALSEDGFPLAAEHEYETDTISNRAVKLYMDGALGSRGALLIEPYSDRPDTNGLSLLEPEGLHNLMMKAEEEDVQLAIHAIGDLANRRILNVYEELDISPDRRWRIEHTQILHPDDIARIPELGLIASMQPSHAIGDLKFAPSRLGFDRLDGAYAWQDLLDAGAVIAGGSDAPVEVGSPLIEFYAAVAREDLEGNSGEGWHPEQALSRQDALALFTSSAAYAAFMEDDLGTIELGKLADFTVFDRDLMTVPEDEILEANAVMTVVNGEIVWSAAE